MKRLTALALALTLALSLAAVVCSIIGIVFWTILFYKVALKVKMFPMYEVDLNIYM